MTSKIPRIYVSAAMRSGSTLVSNILNAHKDILILENFHFQRFIYKGGEKLTKNLIKFRIKEMALRLGLRYNYNVNSDYVIKRLLKKNLTYKNMYDELINDQKKINNLNIVGEDSALNWRFIEKFNKFYKNAKVIHLIRDPRSIFASWKKATYQKIDYWGCMFNCLDNMNYAEYYYKSLSPKKYMVVKFEDILDDPRLHAKRFCKFLNIKFTENMVRPELWESIFKNKNANLGWSSIEKKKMSGFYKNRINSWKRYLNDEEIFVVQTLLKKQMLRWNYKIIKTKKSTMYTFFKCLQKSEYLKKCLELYLENNEGTDKLQNDPTDFRTWGDGQKNKKKFMYSKHGKIYIKNLRKLKKHLKIKL